MPPELDDRLVPLLTEILATLQALPDAIARASAQPKAAPLGASDKERLALVLPAISDAIGDYGFTVKDLYNRAERSEGLALALERAFGSDAGAKRKLGRLLSRSVCASLNGLMVHRVGHDRDGDLWMVREG